MQYTEDTLVQTTIADYLQSNLGWQSVYAFNNEDFGPESLLGRASDHEVVLTRFLREALIKLNPELPDDAYEAAIRKLEAVSASLTITAANSEKYEMIRDGVPITFTNAEGKQQDERLRVIDFETPENNHFLCVRELWIKGDLYRRRADIVGFVNGLPLLFIECKNIHRNLKAAFEENYLDYRDAIPHLLHHNAIVMFANGAKAKIGSITSEWGHFHEWKRLAEEEPGIVEMETMLKGVCNKRDFLDIVENFIVFDDSTGKTRKILARNHQFLGVNRAIESVRGRRERNGKLGVFWHTQGAGKSYSMVMFTRKIHRKMSGGFTFLVLTDREDLDTQIYKTFAGCGVVNHDREPCRAESGRHLKQLLSEQKTHIFSLIHKFNNNVAAGAEYTLRDDVIVISDEAHRTQYGSLALNMRNALPNASYIGFTGTPLFKDGEITRQVFGDYVSTYDFKRAVEDNATVPLYYDARGEKLNIAVGDINERIAEALEKVEIEDIDVRQRLESDLRRDYHIITAEKRLDQIARDFVDHYSEAWESGKAMLVCIDKLTCVKMHNLITQYWNEKIKALESEFPEEDKAEYLRKKTAWMKETRAAVVVSEEQGEVAKFRKWELDILPHRRLIRNGMELPEAMRRLPQYSNMQRMELDDAFKAEEHPFRIAIVCAMWMTGFDVPCLSTLYLDKPLKAHTLMQAIARANRVNEGKNNGFVVDYCGVLKNLREALATFTIGEDGEDGSDPARPAGELLEELEEAIGFVREFLTKRKASLDDVITAEDQLEQIAAIEKCGEAANENDETRKRFEVMCREVFRKFKACINLAGVNDYRSQYEAINIVYKTLQRSKEKADISDIIRELHKVVDGVIETRRSETGKSAVEGTRIYNISKINFDLLKREFTRSRKKKTTVQNLKSAIEHRLKRLIEQNPLREDFQKRYEEIVAGYNREKDRVTIEQTFENLLKLAQDLSEEEERAKREGLDEEQLAVFDLLKKPDLTADEIKQIKEIAVELLAKLKAEELNIDHWRDKETTRDAVHVAILDFLYDEKTGLPEPRYSNDDVKNRANKVYSHVLRVYPVIPSPYYEAQPAE